MRTEPKAWGPSDEPPTFLPPDALTIERSSFAGPRSDAKQRGEKIERTQPRKQRKVKSDSVITSAPKQPVKPLVSRHPSESTVKPLPAPPAGPVAAAAPIARPTPAPVSAPMGVGPAMPGAPMGGPMPGAPIAPPFVQFEGGASFDPLALPLPPELGGPVYDWLRRLALQADLAAADKLLREAFADLTSSLSCMLIYSGPDGLHTVGATDELPKDQSPIVAVARSRRALCTSHVAYVPIATTTETLAVVMLTRNTRQPAFNMVDQVTMAGLARESASIMHHLVVQHLQRRGEAEADKKSLYRPEALESHRRRGQEGVVTELSPGWVRRTYWVLVIAILVGIVFATWVQVPTYSTGSGVVVYNGTPVVTPAPGTVDKIYVESGWSVHKGDPIVRIKAEKEEADLRQAKTELDAALGQYLFDNADETIRKSLVTAQAATKRAQEALEVRTIRAPIDGTISDMRVHVGAPLEFGAPITQIVAPGTEPEMLAYMPASDLPRFRDGMELQISLAGYEKTPEKAKIYKIEKAAVAGAEAKRNLGPELADAIKLMPETSYVIVRAKLPKTFRAKGHTYRYHQGMPAKTEVRVESKRFIVTLLPSLEKYLP